MFKFGDDKGAAKMFLLRQSPGTGKKLIAGNGYIFVMNALNYAMKL